jgi:putative inorganic carbon (HCO3(-)) transporter
MSWLSKQTSQTTYTIGMKKESISTDCFHSTSSHNPLIYYVFLTWAFVLMGRPQDIFTFLSPVRPALTLCLLTIFLAVIQRSKLGANRVLMNSQGKLYIALLCVMAISVPFAYYRSSAFIFLVTVYVNAAIFFILFYRLVDSTKKIEHMLFIVCLSSGLYSLAALLKGVSVGAERLAFGEVFDPNDLAYFAVSFLPFNLYFLSRENPVWKRILSLGNILACVMLILKTGSRGGFIALCLVGCMLLFAKKYVIKRSYKITLVVLGLLVFFFSAFTINFSRFETITEIGSDYNTFDETGRISIWKKGFGLMLSHPFGVGVSCFGEAIGKERLQRGLREIWQAPHNSFIQIGTETGFIGLILYILITYRAFRIFGHTKNTGASESLIKISEMAKIGFCGHFVASMFLSQAYSIYWVFFIILSTTMQNLIMAENRAV